MQPTDLYRKLQEERFKHARIRLIMRDLYATRNVPLSDPHAPRATEQGNLEIDGTLEAVTDSAFHVSDFTTNNVEVPPAKGRINYVNKGAYAIVPFEEVHVPLILKLAGDKRSSSQP